MTPEATQFRSTGLHSADVVLISASSTRQDVIVCPSATVATKRAREMLTAGNLELFSAICVRSRRSLVTRWTSREGRWSTT